MGLDSGDKAMIGVIVAVVAIVGCMIFAIVQSENEDERDRKRLIQQCLDDGKKEYECVSMLSKKRSSVTPVAVPVYIKR